MMTVIKYHLRPDNACPGAAPQDYSCPIVLSNVPSSFSVRGFELMIGAGQRCVRTMLCSAVQCGSTHFA